MKVIFRLVVSAALLSLSATADAHLPDSGFALRDGFLHPWLGWDHLLAMLSVGAWTYQQRRPSQAWQLPAAFVLAAAIGAIAGRLGGGAIGEVLVAITLVGLGALILGMCRMSTGTAIGLLAAMGLVHGWVHGAQLPQPDATAPFILGLIGSTALLHAAGFGIAAVLQARGAAPVLRLGGLGLTAAGCGLLLA